MATAFSQCPCLGPERERSRKYYVDGRKWPFLEAFHFAKSVHHFQQHQVGFIVTMEVGLLFQCNHFSFLEDDFLRKFGSLLEETIAKPNPTRS